MAADTIEARRTGRTMRLACVWCGVPTFLLLMVGVLLAGIMPPPSPSDSAAQVAEHYRSNTDSIRAGLAISFPSLLFFYAFAAVIAAQARRIEPGPPVFSIMMTTTSAVASISFIAPWVFWLTAAFRPERADTEIALLHDLGWIFFVFGYVGFSAWNLAFGLVILSDRDSRPAYPRWFGYFNFLVATGFAPANGIVFFKDGPFAWGGLFPYWNAFILYGIWIAMCITLTTKLIRREGAEDDSAEVRKAAALQPASVG